MKQLMLIVLLACIAGINATHANMLVADTSKPFMMQVDEVNFITGAGVAVVGTISEGTIRPGQTMQLIGKGVKVVKITVSFISMYTRQVPTASKGDHATIVLKGVSLEEVKKGMMLTNEGIKQE